MARGSYIGHHERVGKLVIAERTWPVAVQVERTETGHPDTYRESEDRPGAPLHRGRGEGLPARHGRCGQVRLHDGPPVEVCVHRWAFTEGVLQLLDQLGNLVTRTKRALGQLAAGKHDRSAAQRGHDCCHLAQRLTPRAGIARRGQLAEDAHQPVNGHARSPSSDRRARVVPGRQLVGPSGRLLGRIARRSTRTWSSAAGRYANRVERA